MGITATIFLFVPGAVALVIPVPEKKSLGPSGLPPSEELALEENAVKPEEVNADAKPEQAEEVPTEE